MTDEEFQRLKRTGRFFREKPVVVAPDPNGYVIPTRIRGDWETAQKFQFPNTYRSNQFVPGF